MSRRYLFSFLLLISITLIYSRCNTNKFDIDLKNIQLEIETNRLDQDIFNTTDKIPKEFIQYLYQTYGDFYPIYVEQIIRIGSADSINTIKELEKFAQDTGVYSIQEHINRVYKPSNIENHSLKMTNSFKRWKFHFPNKTIPKITYFNSAFNYGIVTTEKQLGIGLDFYLGKSDSLIAKMPGEIFNQYEKDKMDPIYLERDAIEGWIREDLKEYKSNKNLLSIIVYEGKLLYILNALFPNTGKEIVMRYTADELKWVEDNKVNVWKEIAKQKVIFGTQSFENQKWIINGPFTNAGAIPNDSPARIGCWIGWQMVSEFMDNHPNYSLQQLMDETNYQHFLNSYKP